MGKGSRKRRRQSLEGVPSTTTHAAPPPATSHVPPRRPPPSGVNTLRAAHRGAQHSKAAELWFRKCGHGEALLEQYYRAQPVVPPPEQRAFWDTLRRPLPVTFRVGKGAAAAEAAAALAAGEAAARVGWADGSLDVWQAAVSLDKRGGRGAAAQELARLLHEGSQRGAIHRQEAVSMLPVLALRVRAGASCLDMCASPGSKTMQLLEAVAACAAASAASSAPPHPSPPHGFVLANDAHPKRAATLLDAIARHGRPHAELRALAVCCHRGEALPAPSRPFDGGAACGFDYVLADVPCSGDGTVRKDASVLPRWTPALAHQLHATQLAIAWRGLELLRVGGVMAYSTCSLNPIEDEAVVAALLARAHRHAPGAVRLEAWPEEVLPLLRRREGTREWRVADHVECDEEVSLRFHASYDDALRDGMEHAVPTLWPAASGAAHLPLERCSRLLPHDQDTGGFFIALLRKTAPLPSGEGGPARLPAASASELPAPAEILRPRPLAESEAAAAALSISLPSARVRVLQSNKERVPRVLPPALESFAPGALHLMGGGVLMSNLMGTSTVHN
ncbi:hypothetical protein AB1Y20_023061 [Prymnesium parvum]|uniref:SAM-dependent MTase RsmB/NOP-type domain-containing protein n=1 Tax=Prymnesium parvum TaxID=97485 RepID=A0AB34JCZ7_PRYPA